MPSPILKRHTTLRSFRRLALVAAVSLAQAASLAAAQQAPSADALSKELIALREKISKQAEALRSKRRAMDEIERQSAIQSSQLEMQIAKVEARLKALKIELTTHKGSHQSNQSEDAARIQALKEDLNLLQATMNKLAPIRKDERLAAVAQLEQSLSNESTQPLRGYKQLIELVSAEQELASAVGVQRQTLDLDGQATPVTLFHVGHASVVFKSIDGRVGFVTLNEGAEHEIHLLKEGLAKSEIERVVVKAQQGVPVHEAVLPLSRSPLGTQPGSTSKLGQESSGSQNKL
jgi:hypothetical protein